MKLVLQKLLETPDALKPGDVVGQVSLQNNGELEFSISDQALERRLRDLFSKPLKVRTGDPSGRLNITVSKSVKPGTPEFLENVLEVLEGPEYRITGHIER